MAFHGHRAGSICCSKNYNAAIHNIKVVNASISGETASGGRQRIAHALRQHSPSIVILELGANDGLRGTPIADIETNLSATYPTITQRQQKSAASGNAVAAQLWQKLH